jgi:hypothetical protein
VTGNTILNEGSGDFWSLWVTAMRGAVTGNVLRGDVILNVPPPTSTTSWQALNSISVT